MARQSGGVLETRTKPSPSTRKKNTKPRHRATLPAGERVLLEPLPPLLPVMQAELKPESVARYQPTEAEIRERAYQLYLERGCRPGGDLEDWTRAEQELRRMGRVA
ncbi:hypothetical protein MNBD_PLANCTO03-1411 [hydrothermal vent metagenome]|uniref:DUF2934 domain-containing protein n=1 Tax=hydrothermal vent metagenome TaxID=652676 RepID=A0A3B1DU21_9ZZZZ